MKNTACLCAIVMMSLGAVGTASAQSVCYSVRVQGDSDFRSEVCDGTVAGTTALSLRLEQIKIRGTESNANMCYRVNVQGTWSSKICNNNVAGTVGKRIEAIEILDSSLSADLSVYYQVHVQNYGWIPIRWDGALGGTTGKSLRMEAIAIAVQPRSACPDAAWNYFSNGDALMAFAADLYPGGQPTCDWNNTLFYEELPQGGMEYFMNPNDGVIYTGNGWYYFNDTSGNVWNVVLDRYNNIDGAWWDLPNGDSISLGRASREWSISAWGTGVSMM